MTSRRPRRAQSSSARRRGGARTTPVGYWCAGVTNTARDVAERVDVQPSVVHQDRGEREPPAFELVAGAARARVLVPDRRDAALREHLREQRQPWATPLTTTIPDGSARTPRDRASHVGERRAQLAGAARVAVAERGVRRAGQRGAFGAEPGLPRERREVGQAGAQVDRHGGPGSPRTGRDGGRRSPWPARSSRRRAARRAAPRRSAAGRPRRRPRATRRAARPAGAWRGQPGAGRAGARR